MATPNSALFAVLGASNVTFSLPQLLDAAQERLGDRVVDYFVAHGPGRSYGSYSGVALMAFPALSRCDLYAALESRAEQCDGAAVHTLFTDIGNDLPYGASVDDILGWVGDSVRRCQSFGANVAVTALPAESVRRVPAWKYHVLRRLYYPSCTLSQAELMARVLELQSKLPQLCDVLGVRLLSAPSDWYGFDHFHLSLTKRRHAFSTWFSALLGTNGIDSPAVPKAQLQHSSRLSGPRNTAAAVRLWRPSELRLCGRLLRRAQAGRAIAPAARLFLF